MQEKEGFLLKISLILFLEITGKGSMYIVASFSLPGVIKLYLYYFEYLFFRLWALKGFLVEIMKTTTRHG